MAEPFLGEIKLVPYNFAPLGWAFCAGQLMPISQNEALFALVGTFYGGDGVQTFALPDLQGRAPIHQSFTFPMGSVIGTETVTLNVQQIPAHVHAVHVSSTAGTLNDPTNHFLGGASTRTLAHVYADSHDSTMNAGTVGMTGSGLPHDNMQPYLVMNYIIALQGIFPTQN